MLKKCMAINTNKETITIRSPHYTAVCKAAKDVYETIERANCRGIVVNVCVETKYEPDGRLIYVPKVETDRLSKARKIMTKKEKELSENVVKAMGILANTLTLAAKDGYAFTIKRIHGSMFTVRFSESQIEA